MTVRLNDLILSLYECAISTTEEEIRAQVQESFLSIGRRQPTLFLEASNRYLLENSRLSSTNHAYVLLSVAAVLETPAVISQIEEQRLLLTINWAIQEMLMAKDEETEWSDAGRSVLMVLSKNDKLVKDVCDGLLQKFPAGVVTAPPKSVVLTLASIAQCNPSGFLPFLTDILSRTVILLPHIKSESQKAIWARALSAFCEALAEFSPDSPNGMRSLPQISEKAQKEFGDQMEPILDTVMTWLNAKDPKCRAESFEAVGSLILVVSQAKILKELKKIVTTFLNLYKKGSLDDQFVMTKGICNFLVRTCSDDAIPLDSYLDDILSTIFQHVAVHNDQIEENYRNSANPTVMRLRNEVCRCFLAISQRFADRLVYWLLHKMQSVHDSTKLGAIDLIRHLLNSAECHMEDKRSLIVMGLKGMLRDEGLSIKAKMSMCQLCVALADHGYVHIDSGGENVIFFLISNLIADVDGVIKKTTPPTQAEISQLRTHSAQALCTIAKTCESSQQLLWPNLLEYICAENYNPVVTEIFKCLRILLIKMQENDNAEISFSFGPDINPRVAGPHQVLTRILACMNISPHTPQNILRAKEAIKLLEVLAPAIQPSIKAVVDEELPDLMQALDGSTSPIEGASPARSLSRMSTPDIPNSTDIKKAKVERFQTLVMKLLKEITTVSCTKEWLEALASAQGKQLAIYNKYPHEKAFLAQCLGFTLSRITTDSFVREHVVLIFRGMNHSNMIERRGCASAVGEAARQHTSLMLTELENIAKWEHSKKASGGLFGFIKEAYHRAPDAQAIFLRATIVLSYGYLVNVSPIDFLPQRLDQTVLPFLRQYMAESKSDVVVREAHLETIHMIAESVARLTNDYRFDARYEMLSYIKEYVNQEEPETLSNWIRLYACRATSSLVSLEPPLSDNELRDLATVLSKHVLTICREKSGLKTIDNDESSTTMEATVSEYRNAIARMIKKKPIVDTVCTMLKIFINYYGSTADYERIRSIDVTVLVLRLYWKYATDLTVGHASDFPPLSFLLARLTPRIVDSLCAVRHLACNASHMALQLGFLHKGQISQSGNDVGDGPDPPLFDLQEFKTKHLGLDGKLDSIKGREAITLMGREIEAHLPQSQLQTYISAIFKMLSDKQNNVSSAAALLLSIILKDRGRVLHDEAEIVVVTILENLPLVHSITQTYDDLLHALTYFADEQLYTVIEILLKQPLPYSSEIKDCWKFMVKHELQFAGACDHILDLVNCTSAEKNPDKPHLTHFEIVDLSGGCVVMLVNSQLCAHFAALSQMIEDVESDDVVKERFPRILSAIFHNLAAVIETQYPSSIPTPSGGSGDASAQPKKKKDPPIITAELKRLSTSPASLVVDSLNKLLHRIRAENVIEAMNQERAWSQLSQLDGYISAIGVACRSLCDYYPNYMRSLMLSSIGNVEAACKFLRISSATILSALITRCPLDNGGFDESLLDKVVEELKYFAKDKHLLVRKLAIRGYTAIGTLASSMPNGDSIAQKYAQLAFEAALNGLDDAYDRADEIAAESVYALDSIVTIVDKQFINKVLSNLLLKLRPCFEKENVGLRGVAFSLFGKLGSLVGDSDIFRQNIHENIVSILLHLNDEDDTVKENCANVLTQIAPLFSLDTLTTTVSHGLINSKPPSSYPSFLKDVGMILVLSFPDRLNFYALGCSNYFKSQFPQIRSNAALFTGFLLEPLTPALRGTLSKDLIFTSLVTLLRDPSSLVRQSTVKAISCLHSFS